LAVCSLLVKEGLQREVPDLAYCGFTIPPEFVVGYGLDAGQKWRHLDHIRRFIPIDT
jgi:hypoxanthine phosphoribosyltransferase